MGDILRDRRKFSFARVECEFLRDPEINPQLKTLYSLLITYGPARIFPGHETLAKCLNVSRQTTIIWLKKLKNLHLIDWKRTGRSNEYEILGYDHHIANKNDVKPELHQMSSKTDISCKPGFTRSRSMKPDPSNQKKTSSPDDSLWPTDSNFPPREETTEEKPITATDPLTLAAECALRSEGKKSWTVTADAGGADPYQDGPLKAACAILRIDSDSLAEEEKRTWARQLRRITKAVKGGTPRLFVEACKAWSSAYEWKGKSGAPYSNVFRGAFPDDMAMLMRQVKSGTAHTAEVRISN